MNIAAPDCIQSVTIDRQTGRPTWVSVCAWCQEENKEGPRLELWRESMGITQAIISHGICDRHAEALCCEVDKSRAQARS